MDYISNKYPNEISKMYKIWNSKVQMFIDFRGFEYPELQ